MHSSDNSTATAQVKPPVSQFYLTKKTWHQKHWKSTKLGIQNNAELWLMTPVKRNLTTDYNLLDTLQKLPVASSSPCV